MSWAGLNTFWRHLMALMDPTWINREPLVTRSYCRHNGMTNSLRLSYQCLRSLICFEVTIDRHTASTLITGTIGVSWGTSGLEKGW